MIKDSDMSRFKNIGEVARLFFKLGCIAFGGPAAHIAMMEEEVVNKRKWMDRQHFLDLVGATNLIPGPNSTEITMHCGHVRAGVLGLFVAGLCFICPAVCITLCLAYVLDIYGHLPELRPFISGIEAAVLAMIVSAIVRLGKKALKNWELVLLGCLVLLACVCGVHEIWALLSAGLLGMIYFEMRQGRDTVDAAILPILTTSVTSGAGETLSTSGIFWTFLKVGSVLYGSGYVLFAYLDAELVTQGWLSSQQLVEAIGMGQFTPGPALSTATYIGYQLGGVHGAVLATVGIFLPSFVFVLLLSPFVAKIRNYKVLGYFLDSVNIAAVAVMIIALVRLGSATLTDWRYALITAVSIVLVLGIERFPSMWIVVGGAVLGYLFSLIGGA